ncbi:MAG: type II toxin-antitoxin system PemK/MazF family toxin [Candidatus Nanohalobium sp.]
MGPDFIRGNNRRPFVVISNENHPFHEECLVVLITTTEREEAIPLPEEKFRKGKLPKESYASPWTVTTLKNTAMQDKLGELKEETLKEIRKDINDYIKVK